MAYTKSQASKIAQQIHTRFGAKVEAATAGTPAPPEFVAGLIGVEAGKDRQGRISETATRFEPGVYDKLVAIRAGRRKSWSHIKQADIKDATDGALRNLATSFGLCQVMGWHTIHNLDCTIAQLRDPSTHLRYAVQLLMLNSKDGDFERRAYVGEFKEWNSGSETGKTYRADYVANAGAVMDAYRDLGPVPSLVTESVTEVEEQKAPAKAEPQPQTPADVVVTAEQPKETNPKEKAEVSGPKSWIAGATTFLTTAGAGAISWINGASKEIVIGFFAAAGIVGVAYMVSRYWYRNKENQRLAEVQLAREKMAHELTVLKIKSAMDRNGNTVEIAKP